MSLSAQDERVLPSGPPEPALYCGRVVHKRLKPFLHELTYRVFSLLVDIDRVGDTARNCRFLGYNRPSLISFYDKDHGLRDGGPLRPWVEAQMRERGIDLQGGPIRLLCFPRVWGYTFNPLAIYYCYDPQGNLGTVLYQVSNTFGEWHGYLLKVESDPDALVGNPIQQSVSKVFHVSPFMEVKGGYKFTLQPPGDRLSIMIRQTDTDGSDLLVATHTAKGAILNDRQILTAFCRHPALTFKIMGAIHWEALKLWRKGAPFFTKPAPPKQDVTS